MAGHVNELRAISHPVFRPSRPAGVAAACFQASVICLLLDSKAAFDVASSLPRQSLTFWM
jgi:hypothetical protein